MNLFPEWLAPCWMTAPAYSATSRARDFRIAHLLGERILESLR